MSSNAFDVTQPGLLPDAAAPGAGSEPHANVIVLCADSALLDVLKGGLAPRHRVWRADNSLHAAELVVAAGHPVLLVDAAVTETGTADYVRKMREQFPDLVVMVSGRRDDEALLGGLISSGDVYRFLHKPISSERARNFVDGALRRMLENTPEALAAQQPKLELPKLPEVKLSLPTFDWRRFRGIGLLLALGAIAAVAWPKIEPLLPDQLAAVVPGGSERNADAASRGPKGPPIEELLGRADAAFAAGQLLEPEGRSALDLYAAATAREAREPRARAGLDRVADALLADINRYIETGDLEEAAIALGGVRRARPNHPDLPSTDERFQSALRVALTRGKQAIAAAESPNQPPTPRAAIATTSQNDPRLRDALSKAYERIRRGQPLVDGADSARSYLVAAEAVSPGHPEIAVARRALSQQLVAKANGAIARADYASAQTWIGHVANLGVEPGEVTRLKAELENARGLVLREERVRLLATANQRLAQGRLLEPAADSARHYLDLLRAADPNYRGLAEATSALAARLVDASNAEAAAGRDRSAREYAAEAISHGAAIADLVVLTPRVAAPSAAPSVAPESSLRRVKAVPPVYPSNARSRGTEGWVDVEFTVLPDGSTSAATIVAAEPAGVFDRAVLDAVERWRYEPPQRNGAPVAQRVGLRLRFNLER